MKKLKKHNSIKVGNGRIIETSFGTYMAYMRSNGKRYRKCFNTFTGAEQYLESLTKQEILPPLTSTQLQDARIAFSRLPSNIRLCDVVAHYLANTTIVENIQLSVLVDRYLAINSLRSITIRNHKTYLRKMLTTLGDKDINQYTTDNIQSILKEYPLPSQRKALSIISAWFAFAIKNRYMSINPCDSIPRPQVPESKIRIYSVQEAETIMRIIEERHPQLVWYFAIGLFAGIRPYEMRRLKPSDICGDYIYLDGSITKTAHTRSVIIADNLKQWLSEYPMIHNATRSNLDRATTDIKHYVTLIQDGMRHSFASYAYEKTKDANLIASEMGHHGTKIFFKHYRALAAPGTGSAYFSIQPTKNPCANAQGPTNKKTKQNM